MMERLKRWTSHAKNGQRLVIRPAVDISETDQNIVLKVEVPGVDKGSLNVELKDNLLVISGERISEKEYEKARVLYQERYPNAVYYREFIVDSDIDPERISAYDQGVLTVTLVKAKTAQPKKIPIST